RWSAPVASWLPGRPLAVGIRLRRSVHSVWWRAGRPAARRVMREAAVRTSVQGLRLALWVGAAVWLCLLIVGFFAPGGWVWGLAGPIGHIYNYVISLWLV